MDPGPLGASGSVVVPFAFDHTRPDYIAVLAWRAQFLHRIRAHGQVDALKAFYRTHPGQFILDWGQIFEPRNPEIGLPSRIPFVFFPRQVDWLDWTLERWKLRQRGITQKSRGSGVSWLAVALSCTLCLFNEGLSIGFGSRKSELVDQLGDPKSLFFKARMFLESLPPEFRCGWNADRDARQMRISFPETGSVMTGEGGDQIGRGDRTSLYFVDEAGFLEHPELAEGSLADTTNCRIDISTAPEPSSPFWARVDALPPQQIFTFHWREDPRRDKAWEEKARRELAPAIFDREFGISRDLAGSFFSEAALLVDGKPVEQPPMVTAVFATIDSALKTGREHDGLGVTYFALMNHGQQTYPLAVLDWDLKQAEAATLGIWLPTVFEQLEIFARECKALRGSVGAFIEDKVSGTVLLQQAANHDPPLPAFPIDSKLTAMGKAERAINISGYIHRGDVKFTRRAHERVVTYKGRTQNHLLSQILGFRAGIKDQGQDDLLDTFCYGVAIALGNPEGF